jgi:hypothetical protein
VGRIPEICHGQARYKLLNTAFVVGLLNRLSNYIDPLLVIQMIPPDLQIPGLKEAVIQTMVDCSVQLSLREGCQKILLADIWQSFQDLMISQTKSQLVVPGKSECTTCRGKIVEDGNHIVVFFCGHLHHSACIGATITETLNESESNRDSDHNLLERCINSVYSRHDQKRVIPPLLPRHSNVFIADLARPLQCPSCQISKTH